MRRTIRLMLVLGVTAGLLAVFLWHADLRRVGADLRGARLDLIVLSAGLIGVNMIVRSLRWQYLLAPLGPTRLWEAFHATVLGFAANAVLPARAGEVIRPWVLARREQLPPAGAFATIVVERLLDMVTVLVLFGVFVLFLGGNPAGRDDALMHAVQIGGLIAALGAGGLLVGLVVLAGDTGRLWRLARWIERWLPERAARTAEHVAGTFASGLAVVRQPRRLLLAFALSVVLWLSIGLGAWLVTTAFAIAMPFPGSFLLLMLLVVGVAVPTPGGVGGFDEAFRLGAVAFFGASADRAVAAAIVLHAVSFVPVTLAGLALAARDGMNLARMRQLAQQQAPGGQTA
ncbi:MAG: flippase-like domain-containing protein [Acidobacteriota bacterium]|nr:flippase-like domain-containing protein [Acidobacteriota bacterium]